MEETVVQEEEEEEEEERPATSFNPLLFSALQSVALSTTQLISTHLQNQPQGSSGNLPLPPIESGVESESGKGEKENVKEGAGGVLNGSGSGKVEVETVKVNSSAPRIGPTGKRKPKKAA